MLCNFLESSRDALRRLVIQQVVFHEGTKLLVQGDLFALSAMVPRTDIRELFRISSVILSSSSLLLEFVPDAAFGTLEASGNG